MRWLLPILIIICFLSSLLCLSIGNYLLNNPIKPLNVQQLFPEEKYAELLRELKDLNYTFTIPRDYLIKNTTGKIAIIIHDTDVKMEGAKVLTKVEDQFGIKSCFYLRVDADYFPQSIPYFESLEKQGWEIGLHYDCLSRMNNNKTAAVTLFKAQVTYIRSFFNVTTTHYHGDNYNLSIINLNLYDSAVWTSLSLKDLCEKPPSTYITDANGNYVEPTSKGDVVLVNLHSDWW
jgi:hypothetical protein